MTGQRRRLTFLQRLAFLDEAGRIGNTILKVARRYGLAYSMMFQRRRAMDDASYKGLKDNEHAVAKSEVTTPQTA